MRTKQIWKCQKCGHEFYTMIEKRQAWYRRLFHRREAIACDACKNVTALRRRVIRFEEKKDEKTVDSPFDAGNFTDQLGSEK